MIKLVRRSVWGVCLVLALGSPRFGEPAEAPTPPRLGPVSRCFCQVSPGDAVGEKECSAVRGPSYEHWRRHVEIMEFTGVTTANQTFTRTIRNVTPDDDVYLRVRLEHPLRYSVSLTLSQTDAPDRVLLNVSGNPMPALGALIEAAAQASAEAGDSRAEAARQGSKVVQGMPVEPEERERALGELTQQLSRVDDDLSSVANRLRQAAVVGGEESAIAYVVETLWPSDGGGPSHQLQQIRESLQPLPGTEARELEKRVSHLAEKTAALETQVAAVRDALDEGDMCLYLGRFEEAKRVQVSATVTERPELLAPPAPGSSSTSILRDAMEKARDLLDEALDEGRATSSGRSNKRGGETAPGGTAAEPEAENSSSSPPTPATVERLTTTFDVMKPVHVQTSFGFPVTWLEESTYSLVSAPSSEPASESTVANGEGTNDQGTDGEATDNTPTPPEMVTLVPQPDQYRVLPTFFVALNLWPQYPFSTEDDDPHESLGRKHRRGLSITVGFPLQDIGKNYLFGAGFYVYPGIQIVGGVHLGRVTRLREDYQANVPFEKPDSNFQVSDATYTPYRWNGYLGVTVDSTTIAKIFGAGGE